MLRKVTPEVRQEWIEILKNYEVEDETAKTIASMVSGDPEIQSGKIRDSSELALTIKDVRHRFGEFSFTELGLKKSEEYQLKHALMDALKRDLRERSRVQFHQEPASTVRENPPITPYKDETVTHVLAAQSPRNSFELVQKPKTKEDLQLLLDSLDFSADEIEDTLREFVGES